MDESVREQLQGKIGADILHVSRDAVIVQYTDDDYFRGRPVRIPFTKDANGGIRLDNSGAEFAKPADVPLTMAQNPHGDLSGQVGWPNPVNTADGEIKSSSWQRWIEKGLAPADVESAKYFLPIYAELEAVLFERGWRRTDVSLREKALDIAQQRRADLPRLSAEAQQIAVRTFAADEFSIERMQGPLGHEKTRMDMASSESEYRMMQRIAQRDGHQLPRDLYTVREKLFRENPERRPRLHTAESLEDAAMAAALDAGWRLDLMTADQHVEACQRAAQARPDLLKREYGVDVKDEATSAAAFQLTEEDKRNWRDVEKLMDMARQRVRARGGDVSSRREIETAVAELVRENPSLIAERYGMKR